MSYASVKKKICLVQCNETLTRSNESVFIPITCDPLKMVALPSDWNNQADN